MPQNQTKTLLIKPVETNIDSLIENKWDELASCVSKNLILDLSDFVAPKNSDLKKMIPLSKAFKKAKKSLVLIVQNFDFDTIPAQLVVVPTIQEAHDIIEFDEIERDLGF